jgi:hypothetical protein
MKNHVFKNETMLKNAAKWGQMGPDWGAACPFLGISYFRKKCFGVFGGCNGAWHVPFWAFLISGKNVLAFLGDATARGMSQNRGFLFPEKMVWRFRDMLQNAACPFLGISYFEKITMAVWQRFFNCRGHSS